MAPDEITEMLTKQEAILENLVGIVKDHELRIRSSERFISYGIGAIGILSAIFNFVSYFTKH